MGCLLEQTYHRISLLLHQEGVCPTKQCHNSKFFIQFSHGVVCYLGVVKIQGAFTKLLYIYYVSEFQCKPVSLL